DRSRLDGHRTYGPVRLRVRAPAADRTGLSGVRAQARGRPMPDDAGVGERPHLGNDPNPQRAWGYTDMVNDFSVIHPLLCAGALAVADSAIPAWQRGIGVLVLVHESFHLRRWSGRYSEAQVECQAIRHFRRGAELLGASPELANDLLPYGLAAHDRMVRLYPNYRARTCKLPLWTLPFSP